MPIRTPTVELLLAAVLLAAVLDDAWWESNSQAECHRACGWPKLQLCVECGGTGIHEVCLSCEHAVSDCRCDDDMIPELELQPCLECVS